MNNKFALIIGVGADLPVTAKDAQDIYKLLVDPKRGCYLKSNVQLLTDLESTKENIVLALDKLESQLKLIEDAALFVYYSGHGGRMASNNLDDEAYEYFLYPNGYDATNRATLLEATYFTSKINSFKTTRKLIAIDCCHAGGINLIKKEGNITLKTKSVSSEFINSNEQILKMLNKGTGTVFLSSCKDNETSVILPGAENSLFTQITLDIFNGIYSLNTEYISVIDYLFHVLTQVVYVIAKYNHSQTPVISSLENLDAQYYLCRNARYVNTTEGNTTQNQNGVRDYTNNKAFGFEAENPEGQPINTLADFNQDNPKADLLQDGIIILGNKDNNNNIDSINLSNVSKLEFLNNYKHKI